MTVLQTHLAITDVAEIFSHPTGSLLNAPFKHASFATVPFIVHKM